MWLPPSPTCAPETWTTWYHTWRLWFRQGLLNIYYLGHAGLITKRYWIWKREQAKIQERLWTDERGYWFCNIVTVLPEAQGRGIGRLLFEDVMEKADEEGTRCYLESSREEPNVKIYEKLGFEVKGTMRVEDEGEACDVSFLLVLFRFSLPCICPAFSKSCFWSLRVFRYGCEHSIGFTWQVDADTCLLSCILAILHDSRPSRSVKGISTCRMAAIHIEGDGRSVAYQGMIPFSSCDCINGRVSGHGM